MLLGLVLVCLPSYCLSESIKPYYGTTPNAAANQALQWSMGNILPSPPGLYIQNVLYSYTMIKEDGEAVTVYVQNENANGTGYIFRDREDWSPTSPSGQEVRKVLPVGNLHRDLWGDGSIEVVGNGQVEDPSVIYTYRVDPCYDPQFDPNCPGYEVPYVAPPQIDYDLYDVTEDDYVVLDRSFCKPGETDGECLTRLEEEAETEEEIAENEAEEDKDRADRLEKALAEAGKSELFALAFAQSQLKDSINANLNSYYAKGIPGGEYRDSRVIVDTQLPENQNGLRNGLAQQLLHQQMIDMQYEIK